MNQPAISDYYRQAGRQAAEEIRSDGDSLLARDSAEYVDYLVQKYELQPLDVQYETATFEQGRDLRREVDIFGDPVEREYETITISIPCTAHPRNGEVVRLRAETWRSMNRWNWEYDARRHAFTHHGVADEAALNREIDDLRWRVERLNDDITAENESFRSEMQQAVDARKSELQERGAKVASVIEAINLPLQRSDSPAGRVDLKSRRPLTPTPAVTKPDAKKTQVVDYELTQEQVDDVVGQVWGFVSVWERTPGTFGKLAEEELRDLLVAFLDQTYDSATGETFVKKGKSDVYLAVKDRSVLIFECKWWSGQAAYGQAIDQLFGYVTWRHPHAVLLTFVGNNEMSRVVERAKASTEEHDSFRSKLATAGASLFVSQHEHPSDPDLLLTLHHVLVHLPELDKSK